MQGTQQELLEFSACGVGFTVSRLGTASHGILTDTLYALACSEHRGGCAVDQQTGDGSGIMVDIPFELFGFPPGEIAVASIFAPCEENKAAIAFSVFEQTFQFFDLEILGYREVPVNLDVLGDTARGCMPRLRQAFIKRPPHIHTDEAFDSLLYYARQLTRSKEKQAGISKEFFFASLSANTIVYKALTVGVDLSRFYLDLKDPNFVTRFGVYHRRFSTNTSTTWDRAQPCRIIAHNGEINTIAGNRAWAYSREQALGLQVDHLLTHAAISDSGNCNEMVEALKYRSSIPYLGDILSIMVPPAQLPGELHRLWSRAMEPWDGPAFLVFCDGTTIGARLDRNGFRPCRWVLTDDRFYISSEAGNFPIETTAVLEKGTLQAGGGLTVDIRSGLVDTTDSGRGFARSDVHVDARLVALEPEEPSDPVEVDIALLQQIHRYTKEDIQLVLQPMINEGSEPIGSMGNTARPAVLSEYPQPLFNFFYQDFAQVTNPPVDYIRENIVTDLTTYLGRRPNVFAPKELIPPFQGIVLRSHVLSLGELAALKRYEAVTPFRSRLAAISIDTTFDRSSGQAGFRTAVAALERSVQKHAAAGFTILILSDQAASRERAPLPSMLALAAATRALDSVGLRLMTSLVVQTGEVRSAHHLACLASCGADAVCPELALLIARQEPQRTAVHSAAEREQNLIHAVEVGLRRIMAKMGISVARSYQGSRLLSCVGLGRDITEEFFPGLDSPIGGISLNAVAEMTIQNPQLLLETSGLPHTYQYKEHPRGSEGEKHSMTASQSKLLHELVRADNESVKAERYQSYRDLTEGAYPTSIRHFLRPRVQEKPLPVDVLETIESILKRFGSGAMSFGAISAESQRDIFIAMAKIGGRSNSGEGGENPFYWSEGICASVKQVASARFGVTGQYLISANEIQIKMAQGAKPGEGGQLMRAKVDEQIARARHASPGIDLISPPPLHDIYSIEDLKGLIFELKQFNPEALVNVKLVAGKNIGTIAVGVAKAGADIIHISGGDGGTGAAALSSMKHAGLSWEVGLVEVNQALLANGLREAVQLRVDGGLSTGLDIILAAILGADGFDFGKLLLIAEGCIMARVCEKNTCPTGIATHAERFKKKYKGMADHIVDLLTWIARDVQQWLGNMHIPSIEDLFGRVDLLEYHPDLEAVRTSRGISCDVLLQPATRNGPLQRSAYSSGVSDLNALLVDAVESALVSQEPVSYTFPISVTDRAIPATLAGVMSKMLHQAHIAKLKGTTENALFGPITLACKGSAGQGFGVLLPDGITLQLEGEANDSVGKTMSGGTIIITPPRESGFKSEDAMILGNCALYGATGGRLYACGRAGDRFAVRNSGAVAVVEGVGLHACEYMTSGCVLILGKTGYNIGAGMTGGELYLVDADELNVNVGYIKKSTLTPENLESFLTILRDYQVCTGSQRALALLEACTDIDSAPISKWVPCK